MLNPTCMYDGNSSVLLTPEERSLEEAVEVDFTPSTLASHSSTPFKAAESLCAELSRSIVSELSYRIIKKIVVIEF